MHIFKSNKKYKLIIYANNIDIIKVLYNESLLITILLIKSLFIILNMPDIYFIYN